MDTQKAEAFAGRLLTALNDGALCLMASIGHRTGLFDAMRDQPPQTSSEIASRAGLHERYVREWLGAMVTSGVVTVDSQSLNYQLPPEHAAYLTRAAGVNNFAAFTQYVPILGQVEDAIVECFKNGGGVPYVPAVPRGYGRRQWPVCSVVTRVAHSPARSRSGRSAWARRARAGCRMR
jgi:hypothetical protein